MITSAGITGVAAEINLRSPVYSANAIADDDGLTDIYSYNFGRFMLNVSPSDCLILVRGAFIPHKTVRVGMADFIPLRFAAEALGAEIDWNGVEREITVKMDEQNIRLTIDSASGLVNGEKTAIGYREDDGQWYDMPPLIIDERAYVHLSFFRDCLGMEANIRYGGIGGDTFATTNICVIDDKGRAALVEAAAQELLIYLKTELTEALETGMDAGDEIHGLTDALKAISPQIVKDIHDTRFVGTFGCYAMFDGPYKILVDYETKEIYLYKYGNVYADVHKLVKDDPGTFYKGYVTD